MKTAPFHLSLPCLSITETKNFYVKLIGAKLGRNTHQWVDIDLFGNQITFTKSGDFTFRSKSYKFEGVILPSFHFGVIVESTDWNNLYGQLTKKGVITSAQKTFLEGRIGEHNSFFVDDPNGYTIEFKQFKNAKDMFHLEK
jgi:extradiol dioxygenase family protein